MNSSISRLTTSGGGVFTYYPVNAADMERARAAGFNLKSGYADAPMLYTASLSVAARLRDHADEKALKEIKRQFIDISPWTLPLPSPPPGETLKPHQVAGLRFALERNRCYLGFDPGTGKTPIAALLAAVVCDRVIYISPPFLVENVIEEFARWVPDAKVAVYHPKKPVDEYRTADVVIFPDSLIHRPGVAGAINAVGSFSDRTMVVDEAHRFKNADTKRTKILLGGKLPGLVDLCERTVYMSGTPMPNRPIELFPILSKAAPETIDFMTEFKYAVKYCAAYKGKWGWDFTGANRETLKELGERVKAPTGPFMLRVRKSVLKLPPKVEELFILSGGMGDALRSTETLLRERYRSADDLIKAGLAAAHGVDDLHTGTYRRLLGVKKAHAVIPYVKSLMDETKEKIILFAYHIEAVAVLERELAPFKPLVISGKTPKTLRHQRVKEFQSNPARRLILGNYAAMGVGFTLTAASREIFIEFDYVPGVNDQASDRAHRIGQTKSVLVQYVVFPGSLDKSVIEALVKKRKAINLV